jgi:hypothetical protein
MALSSKWIPAVLTFLLVGTSAMDKSSFAHIVFQKYAFIRPHRWNSMILTSYLESPQNLNP